MMLAWIRLLRLPNHATAVADVLAGWLIVSRSTTLEPPPAAFWAAAAASLALYAAGMVLNDVADLELDRRERPERPLPSGQIAVARAAAAGWMLLVGGVAAGAVAAVLAGHWQVLAVAAGLAAAVWIYDFAAKSTPAGPLVMGGCRGLNWLLGMTAAGGPQAAEWLLPAGMGIYVAGVTFYARQEAGRSRRLPLGLATAVMAAGLAVGGWFVVLLAADGGSDWLSRAGLDNWLLLWAVLASSVLFRCIMGIATPESGNVQRAVGNAIMSIITLDAVLVLSACGERWAIAVLLLLVPFVLSRRLASPT